MIAVLGLISEPVLAWNTAVLTLKGQSISESRRQRGLSLQFTELDCTIKVCPLLEPKLLQPAFDPNESSLLLSGIVDNYSNCAYDAPRSCNMKVNDISRRTPFNRLA